MGLSVLKKGMILSYHPIFEGDENRTCAGRAPDETDRAAMRAAHVVVLNQGCYPSLYGMARENCPHVFPNYDAKFAYPGKTGQIRLFRETGSPHPRSEIYPTLADFDRSGTPFPFPFVFKFDWGGEGESVFRIDDDTGLNIALEKARVFERSGHRGFLLQEYIPCDNRSLRVAVIGDAYIPYWRVNPDTGGAFHSNLRSGATIDKTSDPGLRQSAVDAARVFCRTTGINLAGFDFLFHAKDTSRTPLFLEINYYFGRKGLGGSEQYYDILIREIGNWIRSLSIYHM